MELTVRENDRIVEIWLTQEENDNAALRENLVPLYSEYKRKKYTVAVFLSGNRNIYDETERLVLYNNRL